MIREVITKHPPRARDLLTAAVSNLKSNGRLLITLLIPIGVLVVCQYLQEESELEFTQSISLGLTVVEWLTYAVVAVLIHRSLLLSKNNAADDGVFATLKRPVAYALVCFVLTFPTIVYVVAANYFSIGTSLSLFVVIALLVWALAALRFVLVFPAIALDRPWSFRWSWDLTGLYYDLLLKILFVLPVIFSLLIQGVDHVPLPMVVGLPLTLILTATMIAIEVAIVSELFRYFEQEQVSRTVD